MSCTRASADTGIGLLVTGEFHGDEVSASPGEEWMGLFRTAGGFELINTKLDVEQVEDPLLDEGAARTGKLVDVFSKEKPVLMIKGADFLKEGHVACCFDGRLMLNPGVTRKLEMDGAVYTLSAHGEGKDEWSITNYAIVLECGGSSQVVASIDTCCDDTMPSLLWAGDLDGDGRLDLYLELSNHYNVSRRTLFLSSLAKGAGLVGKAAEFVTYGC